MDCRTSRGKNVDDEVAAIAWRLVWPRWKLVVGVMLHLLVDAIASLGGGHWSIVLAPIHRGMLGPGGHLWFCRKQGFTWYAVEDPGSYVELSTRAVGAPGREAQPPGTH